MDVWKKISKNLIDIDEETNAELLKKLDKLILVKDIIRGKIRGEIRDKDLSNIDFSDIYLSDLQFINCDLGESNFRGSILDSVDFINSKVNKCDFSASQISSKIMDSSFNDCNFNGSKFYANKVIDSQFKNSSFLYTSFEENYIDRSDLQNTLFNEADIHFNKVTNSDFIGSTFFANVKEYNDDGYIMNNEYHDSSLDYEFENIDSNKLDNIMQIHDEIQNRVNKVYGVFEEDFKEKQKNWIENDYDNEMYEELDEKINKLLDENDFEKAYITAVDEAAYDDKIFMDMVIERCGADSNTLQNAIIAIVVSNEETPEYGAKLLNDILNSNTYKEAQFKNETKNKETVLV